MLLCLLAMLALTRAEIVERMRAPVITQADGLVRVFADCPEDMRREFQQPIARFAADTVGRLYRGLAMKPVRFESPGIVIHVGDVRTNDFSEAFSRVSTNDGRVVSRLYVRSPGHAPLDSFRREIVRAFYRSVRGVELSPAEADEAFRRTDPRTRIADQRAALEDWMAGRSTDFEAGLTLMRKVIEPGTASRRDVLIFASRLYLYPPTFDSPFLGRFYAVAFREAVKLRQRDPRLRIAAFVKQDEPMIFGCGRGEELAAAARLYREFLRELAAGRLSEDELLDLLDRADTHLNLAYERASE